jgi:hypothetical protein
MYHLWKFKMGRRGEEKREGKRGGEEEGDIQRNLTLDNSLTL